MSEDIFFSQFAEDRILNNLFGGKRNGVCVEVGGFDGVTGSTTYFFERLGWKCLVVEPMPDFCKQIRRNRTCAVVETAVSDREGEATFYVAEGAETLSTVNATEFFLDRVKHEGRGGVREITVRTKRLDDLLQEHGITGMDFISIDVEGHELSVLKGFSVERFLPTVILLENNMSANARRLDPYLRRYGYVRFKRTGCNDWYARRSDNSLFDGMDIVRTEAKIRFHPIVWLIKGILKAVLPELAVKRLRALRNLTYR